MTPLRYMVLIDERSKVRYTIANLGPAARPWVIGRADGRGATIFGKTLAEALTLLAATLVDGEDNSGK